MPREPQKIPVEALPEIERRYMDGESLQWIATSYGCSRERIRQLLRKLGVDPKAGGSAERRRRSAPSKALDDAKTARVLAVYGITRGDYRTFARANGYAALRAFSQQRSNAHQRGIEWRFTFVQWWEIWESSGKWAHRGIGLGQYVMSRPGDSGPYSPDNVAIVTSVENILEGHKLRRRAKWHPGCG